ncbi:hypothetical protein NMT12_60050 [metagenome]
MREPILFNERMINIQKLKKKSEKEKELLSQLHCHFSSNSPREQGKPN